MVKKSDSSLSKILDDQYLDAPNKKDLDYHAPYARLVSECLELRNDEDLTQAELAKRMATKQSVISRFENMDGRLPSYDFMARLAIALGHSPGMTLYGDFMAVVPLEKQAFVQELAARNKMPTQRFVGIMIEDAIKAYQAFKCSPQPRTVIRTTQAEIHPKPLGGVPDEVDIQEPAQLAKAS